MTNLAEHMKYKHGGEKTCRAGCNSYENIEHLLECKMDKIDQNIVTKIDILKIKKGVINVGTKEKLQMIMKIIQKRNTILESGGYWLLISNSMSYTFFLAAHSIYCITLFNLTQPEMVPS